MIRNRLITGLSERIAATQYGFQAKKSTAQPIFCARRLIDIAEASGEPLLLLFLDWAKAFDSINHEELLNAIRRLNVPESTLEELKKFY